MKLPKKQHLIIMLSWAEYCLMYHAQYATRAKEALIKKDIMLARTWAAYARDEWENYQKATAFKYVAN